MPKYKVKMIYDDSEEMLQSDGSYDDAIFESEDDAEDAGLQACSDSRLGAEILQMSNPGDYEYNEDEYEVDYEIIEIDE